MVTEKVLIPAVWSGFFKKKRRILLDNSAVQVIISLLSV